MEEVKKIVMGDGTEGGEKTEMVRGVKGRKEREV